MTTRYPSAIDGWLIIVLGIAALISLYACWVVIRTGESMALIVLPAIALGVALPLWILLGTHYTLSPTHLEVRCGPAKTTIPLIASRKCAPSAACSPAVRYRSIASKSATSPTGSSWSRRANARGSWSSSITLGHRLASLRDGLRFM